MKLSLHTLNPEAPCIYVHWLLDKSVLVTTDPEDCIQVVAELKATAIPTDPNLPIDAAWPINLRDNNGRVLDNILVTFTAGQALFAYQFTAGQALGAYRVDDADFDPLVWEGETYQIKLAQPCHFTLTRQLPEL